MINLKPVLSLLASLSVALSASAEEAWEFPEDIPAVEPVTVGLAGTRPADIVRYLMTRGAMQSELSPDGSRVAFSYRVTGEPQLWIVDASGGWPEQLTFGTGIRQFHWSPDNEHLLVTRDAEGNEREGYYLLSADGTEERLLLPLSDAFRSFGMFSRDGDKILFSSTERNGRDFDIYVTDVASGDSRRVYEGSFGFYPRAWQPGGNLVIVDEVRGEGTNDVHLLDMESGEMTLLFHPDEPSYHGDYQWLPDGSGFYFATNNGREFSGLAHYSLEGGEIDYRETPDADVGSVTMTSDGRYIAWTVNEGGYSSIHARDRKNDEALTAPEFTPGVYGLGFAAKSHTLLISVTAPAVPGDLYAWDVSDHNLRISNPVKSTLAGLDPDTFVAPESLTYEARDGLELQGFLYLPDGDDFPFKPPVVVSVHGGPTAQSRPTFKPQVQYLVNNGIAVFDVNVRGSTGFGKTYATLDNREKRLDSVRDLVDTMAYLATDERLNANRAAVMGGSYGGYMVNAVLGSYPGIFDAGASFVGVSDWVRALQEASPALKASDRIEYGDIREKRWQEFYKVNSPINNADKIGVPLFVSHGANDPRDPVTESDRIVRTVRENGGQVRYMRWPDEGHGISKQANRVTFYRQLVGFLEEHLVPDEDRPSSD